MPEEQCSVCGGKSDLVVWRENGYEGRACPCGTVCTWPAPPPGAVDVTHDGHPDTFYSLYASLKARWVHSYCPTGRLLEIGCGEGHFLAAAQSLGYQVAGVEADPLKAARAAQRLDIEVRCSLFENLEWPLANFDVVYHCDLLSHFPDPIAALKKMRRLLAKNGILAFEVGTLAAIHPVWYRWIGRLGYPHHRWLYSERSLRTLLTNAGLQIERTRHFGLAPAVALYRSRVLFGRLIRTLLGRKTLPGSSASGRSMARAQSMHRSSAAERGERIFAYLQQFFRYRVGTLAPRVGPGTLFVSARPITH